MRWESQPPSAESVIGRFAEENMNERQIAQKEKERAWMKAAIEVNPSIGTLLDEYCEEPAGGGEILVLKRGPRGAITAMEDLPSPEGMSVDQLLTSEHFGLGCTISAPTTQGR